MVKKKKKTVERKTKAKALDPLAGLYCIALESGAALENAAGGNSPIFGVVSTWAATAKFSSKEEAQAELSALTEKDVDSDTLKAASVVPASKLFGVDHYIDDRFTLNTEVKRKDNCSTIQKEIKRKGAELVRNVKLAQELLKTFDRNTKEERKEYITEVKDASRLLADFTKKKRAGKFK